MYYVYRLEWSQTDNDTVIFFCVGNPDKWIRDKWPGAFYYHQIAKVDNILR